MVASQLQQPIGMFAAHALTFVLVFNGALAAALALYAWSRQAMPGARPFAAITVLAAATCWFAAAQVEAVDLAAKGFWVHLRYMAQGAIPMSILVMSAEVSGRAEWVRGRRVLAFLAIPATLAVVVATDPWHHGFAAAMTLESSTAGLTLGMTPAPAYWLFVLASAMTLMLGLLLLLDQAFRHGGVARRQALFIMGGLFFPVFVTLSARAAGIGGGVALGPAWYGLVMLVFAYAIFRLGFLAIVPVARTIAFEEMSEGVLVLDPDGHVVDANRAAVDLLAMEGALVRRAARDLFRDWPALIDAIGAHARERVETAWGPRVLQAAVTPLPTPGAPGGQLVLLHDVTAMRRNEAELREATHARGEFLARMSHEVRTPMNGVLGLSGLLLQTTLDDDQRMYARGVRQSAQALLRLVNDVLDFARIDAGRLDLELSAFEPRAIVADAVELIRPEAQTRGLALRIDCDADVPFTMTGDASRIRQVLINLLGNALKFTPAGEIAVRIAVESPPAGGLALRLAVTDTGIGIDQEALERIFQPFVQAGAAATRAGGSGLGLAICRQLVELMGGRIEVRSDPGRGSTFAFSVPVERGTAASPSTSVVELEEDEAPPTRRWSGRVLVADDNGINQLVIVRMLEARGLMVDLAASGVEAIAAWTRVPYDLVLMDCRMPEMDGYEATREIRRRESGRRTPIVAMTAAALPADRAACLSAGMDDHVAKPVRVADLESILSRFIAASDGDRGGGAAADALAETRAIMGPGFGALVRRYLADASASLERIRGAATLGDYGTIAAVAHDLKGSSGIVGATPIVAICQSLVDDPSQAASRIGELRAEVARLRVRVGADVGEIA